jgi:hypothetical protein
LWTDLNKNLHENQTFDALSDLNTKNLEMSKIRFLSWKLAFISTYYPLMFHHDLAESCCFVCVQFYFWMFHFRCLFVFTCVLSSQRQICFWMYHSRCLFVLHLNALNKGKFVSFMSWKTYTFILFFVLDNFDFCKRNKFLNFFFWCFVLRTSKISIFEKKNFKKMSYAIFFFKAKKRQFAHKMKFANFNVLKFFFDRDLNFGHC